MCTSVHLAHPSPDGRPLQEYFRVWKSDTPACLSRPFKSTGGHLPDDYNDVIMVALDVMKSMDTYNFKKVSIFSESKRGWECSW